MSAPLLSIRDLEKHFPIREGVFRRQVGSVKAVDGVSLEIDRGASVGLVGESGCGKTTLGKLLIGLLEPTGGTIEFDGEPLTGRDRSTMKAFRRRVQMVYQDPDSSLNPRRTVGKTLREPLRIHGMTEDVDDRIDRMLERVDLDPDQHRPRFPHELSGGQRQRVGIARALILEPEFLVLDEPTSALDVSVQARILELLADLRDEMDLTFLFISHDLSVVNHLCERVAVMYLGEIVEQGRTAPLFEAPKHPYTEALFSSLHPLDPTVDQERVTLTGETPSASDPPTGCRFHPRCHRRDEVGSACEERPPRLVERSGTDGRDVACHLYEPEVPAAEDPPRAQ